MTEAQIQSAVMKHIAVRGADNCVVWHTPNGGYRSKVEAANFRRQGVKAGMPDVLALMNGRLYALELKTKKGRLSEMQSNALGELHDAGATTFTAYGLDEAIRFLEFHGLVRAPSNPICGND